MGVVPGQGSRNGTQPGQQRQPQSETARTHSGGERRTRRMPAVGARHMLAGPLPCQAVLVAPGGTLAKGKVDRAIDWRWGRAVTLKPDAGGPNEAEEACQRHDTRFVGRRWIPAARPSRRSASLRRTGSLYRPVQALATAHQPIIISGTQEALSY